LEGNSAGQRYDHAQQLRLVRGRCARSAGLRGPRLERWC